jgi:hypothetical protein
MNSDLEMYCSRNVNAENYLEIENIRSGYSIELLKKYEKIFQSDPKQILDIACNDNDCFKRSEAFNIACKMGLKIEVATKARYPEQIWCIYYNFKHEIPIVILEYLKKTIISIPFTDSEKSYLYSIFSSQIYRDFDKITNEWVISKRYEEWRKEIIAYLSNKINNEYRMPIFFILAIYDEINLRHIYARLNCNQPPEHYRTEFGILEKIFELINVDIDREKII